MKHLIQLNAVNWRSIVFTIANDSVWPPVTVRFVDIDKSTHIFRLSDTGKIGAAFQYQKGGVESKDTHQVREAA